MTTTTAIAFTILVAAGAVPLFWAWRRTFATAPAARVSIAKPVLTVVTMSFVLFIGGLFWKPLLGADYTSRRYTTIFVNLAIMVICTVAAIVRGKQNRSVVATSAAIVALEWLYLAAVSSVV